MSVLLSVLWLPFYLLLEVVYFIFRCRPKKEIKNQHILITGAGQGIGAQFARQLSAMGNTVHCVDIDGDLVQGMVEEIKQSKGQAYAYTCDLTKYDQVQQLYDEITAAGFTINMLINNAGVAFITKLTDMTLTQIQFAMTVNIISNLWLIKLFLPKMVEMDKGHIVNIASLAGYIPMSTSTDYCAAKAGSIHALNTLRSTDYVNSNVKFTAVCPYFVNTKMISGVKTPSSMSAEELVKRAIVGIREDKEVVVVPGKFKIATIVISLMPSYILHEILRKLKGKRSNGSKIMGQRWAEKIE